MTGSESMAKELTAERLREVLSYYPDSGVFVWRYQASNRIKAGSVAGYTDKGYNRIKIDRVDYLAHRLVFLYMDGSWPPGEVDHIDGDRRNNCRHNLRLCTRAENGRNIGRICTNTSGVSGVYLVKRSAKWCAQIRVSGKLIHLGNFTTLEGASKSRLAAEVKYGFSTHGRDAYPSSEKQKLRDRRSYAEKKGQ